MSSSTTLTNLVDLAVELINDAKTSKDVKSKLYYLEQVKEIVLFRDTSILIGLIPDIMDFMVETSSQIKKFLIQFCGEALKKTVLISPYVLSLLNFYCTDNNDDLIRFIASELRISYSRLVIFVVNLNVKSKSSTNDPKVLWSQLQHIVEKVIETISSDDKSEITRVQCLRALESIVQFGIPNIEAAKVVDPRLKAKKVEVAVSESTSTEIPLHHQFISRTDIEQEAESLFSKMLLWANKGGPQSHPFTPHQMAQLGQSIANLSSVRHKLLTQASPAVMAILSKPNLCESMSGQHREHFARALHRMMRSLSFQTDSNLKVVITKVRAALERLEGLGFQGQSDVSGRKRTADSTQVVDVDDIEEEDLEAIQLRNSAIEALKASEKNIKLKSAKLSTSTDATRSKDSTISIDNTQSLVFSMSGETELALPSADLEQGVIPALMADVRMSSNLSFGLLQDISASSGGFICVDPVPQPLDAYPLLATASLLRILQCISVGDHKMVNIKIAIKMAMSLAGIEIQSGILGPNVTIIQAFSAHGYAAKLNEGIPVTVQLPRAISLIINFALSYKSEDSKLLQFDPDTFQSVMISILRALNEVAGRDNLQTSSTSSFQQIYENVSLFILSRTMQNSRYRSFCTAMMLKFPSVPTSCLKLLKLLMITGSKTIQPDEWAKSKSIRVESLSTLIGLINQAPASLSFPSLNIALWSTLSEDFEVRSRVIASLTSNVVGLDSAKMRHAALFAIHALIPLIGRDEVAKFVPAQPIVDSMLVDSEKLQLSLREALELYDEGGLFHGQFVIEKDMSIGKFESKVKIFTHLSSQLCISEPRLLAPYFDLFAAGVASLQAAHPTDSNAQESKLQVFRATFLTSVGVIIPAIGSHIQKTEIFNIIKNVDALAFPLVEYLLEICQADVHLPASSTMIENVKGFIRNRHDVFTAQANLQDHSSVYDGIAYADPSVMKFLMSVISGMDAESLIRVVPFVVHACVGNESLLNQAFFRIVQARPPSLTKSGLLIALHRIKPEVFGFDQKVLVHSIGLCLDKKDEFTGDVIQEALNALVQDEQLPEMIMRTAIIGYQTHSELKSYILTTLIPIVIKRSPPCWEVAPKVWDGVIYILNKLYNHKDVEAVIKALLGIPLIHLKGVIEGAPNSKPVIGAYFKSLSADMHENVLDGGNNGQNLQEKIRFLQNLDST